MSADDELMAAIAAQADKARDAAPNLTDTLALALELAKRFDHREVFEIREKIIDHWRASGLFHT